MFYDDQIEPELALQLRGHLRRTARHHALRWFTQRRASLKAARTISGGTCRTVKERQRNRGEAFTPRWQVHRQRLLFRHGRDQHPQAQLHPWTQRVKLFKTSSTTDYTGQYAHNDDKSESVLIRGIGGKGLRCFSLEGATHADGGEVSQLLKARRPGVLRRIGSITAHLLHIARQIDDRQVHGVPPAKAVLS